MPKGDLHPMSETPRSPMTSIGSVRQSLPILVLGALIIGLSGCDDDGPGDVGNTSGGDTSGGEAAGAVFAMTNADGDNEVVVFSRGEDGSLSREDSVSTQGQGEGRGGPSPFPFAVSGTSNPLVLSDDNDRLYVVNPGSDDISAFEVDDDGSLSFIETQSSVGSLNSERPIGLAIDDDLLYVLNAGTQPDGNTPGSITGFTVDDDGALTPVDGSTQPLTASAIDPSQIGFSPDGDVLVVTDKTSQTIIAYPVDDNGAAGQLTATTSADTTPFGFDFTDDGTLIVSDANVTPGSGPVPNGGATSSYALESDGSASVITATSASGGTATCWVQLSEDDDFAYVTNTFSGTVTGYRIEDDGSLSRLSTGANDDGLATVTDEANPEVLDMALADPFLYVADAASGTIFPFEIEDDGSLTPIEGSGGGLPDTTVGVAAF